MFVAPVRRERVELDWTHGNTRHLAPVRFTGREVEEEAESRAWLLRELLYSAGVPDSIEKPRTIKL